YWSGRFSLSSRLVLSSVDGNHGLSRQFICTILAPSGGFSLKRLCVALFLRSGFQVTQISASSSRTVGMALDHAASETGSASSTHNSLILAFDLMLSRLCRSPMNAKLMRPSLVLTYFSPTSYLAEIHGSSRMAAFTSASELSSSEFMNSRPQTITPSSPASANINPLTAAIFANVLVFAEPRPP